MAMVCVCEGFDERLHKYFYRLYIHSIYLYCPDLACSPAACLSIGRNLTLQWSWPVLPPGAYAR